MADKPSLSRPSIPAPAAASNPVRNDDNRFSAAGRAAIGFFGYQTLAQNLAANTWTPILLDAELEDTDNGHSTSTQTSRYVCQRSGMFQASGVFSATLNSSAARYGVIARNGTAIPGTMGSVVVSGTIDTATGTVPVRCAVGDYLELWGYVTTAMATSTASLGGVPRDCSLTVVYLGP